MHSDMAIRFLHNEVPWYPDSKFKRPRMVTLPSVYKPTCGPFRISVIFPALGNCIHPGRSGVTQIALRTEPFIERRKGIRYRLNASVMFRWSAHEKGQFQGEGVTRDMSVAGAYVLTATCPPPNAIVQLEVFLRLSDGGSKALMKADMTVLRVEHGIAGTNRSGFSVAGKGFSLRTFSERATRLVDSLIRESEEIV